ncbi:Mitochondrial intermembrane space cysteine motif-containing protein MIX17 [Meyerozyma sp. JA9]|nr:Mitochondrial intermembrane space cysteine motif-containing protein MIX17 [Meyerozyma sp. JA9]
MPRQRRSAPAPTQRRSAHTAAAAPHYPAAPAAQPQTSSRSPGLFGQMASTAAGVAVGSTIGHTLGAGITGMFGGSSAPPAQYEQAQQQTYQEQTKHCDADARNFTRCLEDNGGNMQVCDFYLQQLKACQEASRQY